MLEVIKWKGTLDGGSCCLVLLASFMIQFVVIGVHNMYGLLYIELLKEYNAGEANLAWIGSIAFSLQFIIGPLTTALCTKFGCRVVSVVGSVIFGLGLFSSSYVTDIYQMYITYSFVFSIGSSFCYFTSILILNEYFTKRLALANGIAVAGCGVGTIAIAPLMNFLVDTFHWRQALRISSASSIVLALGGLFYFLVPAPVHRHSARNKKTEKMIDFSVFKNKAYVVWVVGVGLVEFGFYIPYVHLIRHCQDLNIPKSRGAILVGVIAISQTVGKIFYGQVSDHPRVNRIYLFQMCLLVCSVMTTLLPIFTSYNSLMAYCVIFGLHDGCFVVLIAVLTGDIAGKQNLAPAFGLLYLIVGFPLMLGPAVAGWIYDKTRTYEPAFYMAGAFTTLAVCLLFLVPWLLPAEVRKEWHERSMRCHTPSTDNSTLISNVSDTSPLASELGNDHGDQTGDIQQLRLQGSKSVSRKLADSIDFLSLPKLAYRKESVPSKMWASPEKLREFLGISEETYV